MKVFGRSLTLSVVIILAVIGGTVSAQSEGGVIFAKSVGQSCASAVITESALQDGTMLDGHPEKFVWTFSNIDPTGENIVITSTEAYLTGTTLHVQTEMPANAKDLISLVAVVADPWESWWKGQFNQSCDTNAVIVSTFSATTEKHTTEGVLVGCTLLTGLTFIGVLQRSLPKKRS